MEKPTVVGVDIPKAVFEVAVLVRARPCRGHEAARLAEVAVSSKASSPSLHPPVRPPLNPPPATSVRPGTLSRSPRVQV